MRIFTALLFDKEIMDKLYSLLKKVRENSNNGSFTLYDNLHLTLVFLGEIKESRLSDVKMAIDEAVSGGMPFSLEFNHLGRFKRDDGDILWVSAKKNNHLAVLQNNLTKSLSLRGFEVETREYTPHLTLARRLNYLENYDNLYKNIDFSSIYADINKINLMKSENKNGKLTYTSIYKKNL